MSEEKVRVIEATYNVEKSLAKIKVLKIDSGEEATWALLGDDFDSFMAQASGKSLKYRDDQRLYLCGVMEGLEFTNVVKVDVDNADVNEAKDKNMLELQHGHEAVDRYPFYEIQQEAIEEAMNGTKEDRDES